MKTWDITKHQIETPGGIVAAQHVTAASAGAKVLAGGGNAMDAAVTTALCLSVVEPWLSGVGGGGFLLHGAADGAVETLDFNVVAPRNLDPAAYPLAGGKDGDWFDWPAVEGDRNLIGHSSIAVPGAVAGLAEALERHGSITWAEALAPAIALAERGLELDWFAALGIAIDAGGLARFEASAALFLEDGRAPRTKAAGGRSHIPMPGQAAFLRRLAERGPREMYEGETAAEIVAQLQAGGSVIDAGDLSGYRPRWGRPATATYRGHTIHAIARLSGGPSLLSVMERLARELKPGKTPDAAAASLYARAMRDAYEVRLKTMGHAAAGGDCTTHLSVVDRAGNMVSLTNTLLSRFGSKVVLPATGTLMNNGIMWFDPRPGQPNSMAPGAQPLANMCPLILTRAGRPAMAIGAAGGRQIFPALVQLISYMLDYGMTPEQALSAPRLDPSTPTILIDREAGADVAAKVGESYPVQIVTNALHPVQFAVPSVVTARPDGRHVGMAHPLSPWAMAVAEDAHG